MTRREPSPTTGVASSTHAQSIVDEFQSEFEPTLEVLQRLVDGLPSLQSTRNELSESHKLEYATRILRAVFRQLPWQGAVEFLKSMPVPLLEERIWVSYYLADTDGENQLALFSREELANLIEKFQVFLQSERQHILDTGLPEHQFPECRWLERLLAKTYPVRCTSGTVPFDEPVELDGATSVYQWVRKTPGEHGTGQNRILCRREVATLIGGLSEEDAKRLANLRENILEAKGKVLDAANLCLRTGNVTKFWKVSVETLRNSLTGEQADFLIKMDQIYTSVPDEWKRTSAMVSHMLGYDGPIQPGGFTNLVELVGHVWKECSIETMHKTREALADLVVPGEESDPKLNSQSQWPYFEYFDNDNQSALEDAIQIFGTCDSEEAEFWKGFHLRMSRTIETRFEEDVIFKLREPQSVASELQLNVQTYYAWALSHLECGGTLPALQISSASAPQQDTPEVLARFPCPADIRWEEVTIKFVSDDSVKVSALGESKTYMFSELGFTDGRKGDRPDTRWAIFKELAKQGGRLAWDSEIDQKNRNRAQAAIKDIRRRLEALIGLNEDPFLPYRSEKAYVTKFTLLDRSFPQHEGPSDEQETAPAE